MGTRGQMAVTERGLTPPTNGSDGLTRARAVSRVTEVDSRWAGEGVEAEVALDLPARATATTMMTMTGSAGAAAQGEEATALAEEEMIVEIVVVKTTRRTQWRHSWVG